MRKVFIKKSLNDLIQEQNKLIEKLITQAKESVINSELKTFLTAMLPNKKIDVLESEPESQPIVVEEKEDFSFDESEIPFIPMNEAGDIKLTSLSIEKNDLDTNSIDKLKQTIKESTLG